MNQPAAGEPTLGQATSSLAGMSIFRRARSIAPSEEIEYERRRQRIILLVIRTMFLVILVTFSLLPFVGEISETGDFSYWDYLVPFLGTLAFGVVIVTLDAVLPTKRLASLFAIYLGIIAGLVGALGIGALLDLVAASWDLTITKTGLAYLNLIKLAIGITLCYLAVSIVLTTKDDFRLVIPYVEFAKQIRGIRPLLIDTSVLIDGRIEGLANARFVDAPVIVPQFVINELQTLADSGDKLKRARGRRGLTLLGRLQEHPYLDFSLDNAENVSGGTAHHSVDHLLLKMAKEQNLRILTTDYNLNKVAQIQGVTVLNINDIAAACKSQAIPGETIAVEIVKEGEGLGQGVGYMPDGTMVVVEGAREFIGQVVNANVTNSLQTTAGRMIFGKVLDDEFARQDGDTSGAEMIAKAATHQPRMMDRPSRAGERVETSRRNPRR